MLNHDIDALRASIKAKRTQAGVSILVGYGLVAAGMYGLLGWSGVMLATGLLILAWGVHGAFALSDAETTLDATETRLSSARRPTE